MLVTLSFYSLNSRLQLAFRLITMVTQLVHLPQIPCNTPKFHQHYYYTFGAYQAFRQIYTSDERSTSIKMAVEDMDAMLCLSLRQLKPDTPSFEYRMIYKCDKRSPFCVYMLYHTKTKAASKTPLSRFLTPEGDNGWKVVGNILILYH